LASLTGKTLGRYRLLAQIGRGGMASVYRAYDPQEDRLVAIKVLSAELGLCEPAGLAEFADTLPERHAVPPETVVG